MKVISIILLIVFTATSVAVVPVGATRDLASVSVDKDGERKPRPKDPPPDSGDDGKRPDRPKPPPPDEDRREDRERGDPPSHEVFPEVEYDVEDYHHGRPPWPRHCHCGRIYCEVHEYTVESYSYGTEPQAMVGLYGLATATVMILNLMYASDDERSHNGMGAVGVALGVTGVIWSLNADDPWDQRTLFLSGLLSVGFSLIQWAADSPSSDVPDYRRSTPAASVSFSF